MQSRRDPPHCVVSNDASQTKGGDYLSEGGVRSRETQTQQGGKTWHKDRGKLGTERFFTRSVNNVVFNLHMWTSHFGSSKMKNIAMPLLDIYTRSC